LQQYRTNLTKAHANFISTGVHNGVKIQDLLAGGAYLGKSSLHLSSEEIVADLIFLPLQTIEIFPFSTQTALKDACQLRTQQPWSTGLSWLVSSTVLGEGMA
jgi:hypothetical protein